MVIIITIVIVGVIVIIVVDIIIVIVGVIVIIKTLTPLIIDKIINKRVDHSKITYCFRFRY